MAAPFVISPLLLTVSPSKVRKRPVRPEKLKKKKKRLRYAFEIINYFAATCVSIS